MTSRALGATALRIVGIYLFVQVLAYLPPVVGLLGRVNELDLLVPTTYYVIATVAPPFVLLVCGILLFFRSDIISNRLFLPDAAVESANRGDVEAIAFAVAGLLVFGSSIPGLMRTAGGMVSGLKLSEIGESGHADIPWKAALAYLMQALVGMLLFLQAGTVARWWSRRVQAQRGSE